jgi:FtsP/CotA-like multicopper oxidase with cupredoxin domain
MLNILKTGALLLSFAMPGVAETLQPPAWNAGVKLPEITDTNPDPRIVEFSLESRITSLEIVPGVKSDIWTYNGGLPGPLIRARKGDRLIVHFSNKLPKATTVHWHGVQVPIQMDGVPGASQDPVEPGGTFTYDFVVPDAGLFWYHPHVMSAAQVGFGLYGALLVEDPDDRVGIADQLVLVLSDIAVDDDSGKLQAADSGGILGDLLGREGNHVLLNGRIAPVLNVRDGAPQRWRIVNTAKSRYFCLLLGQAQMFTVIGVDGGLLEYSVERDRLVLAPGERVDVLIAPRTESPQQSLTLITIPFDRGFGSTEFRTVETLMTLSPSPLPALPPAPLPRVTRAMSPMSAAGATPLQINLVTVKKSGTLEFGIEGGPFWKGTSVRAKIGETQLWTLTNKAIWAHPIHLHGYFFQVLDDKGVPVRPLAWKDTVSVPAESTVRLLVRFERPGSWMYHCHILDHAEAGLMSTVDVGEAVGTADHKH